MKKLVFGLILLVLFFFVGITRISYVYAQYVDEEDSSDTTITDTFDVSDFRNGTYYRVYQNWLTDYSISQLDTREFLASGQKSNNLTATYVEDYEGIDESVYLDDSDSFSFVVNVPETALYHIGLLYHMEGEFYTIPSIEVLINGTSLFNEMSDLELDVTWESVPLSEDVRYNRYGNELLPDSSSVLEWTSYIFDDYNSSTTDPYYFLLEEGSNTITITALNLPFYLNELFIEGESTIASYEDYLSSITETETSTDQMITIQAENYVTKNDLEIKASYYKESAMTPYSYKHTVLNELDGDSMARGGMMVTYEFTVEESGYYQIAFKSLHNSNEGIASMKNIYIDGEIPFVEMQNYAFETSNTWYNEVLSDGITPYEIYLTAGTHTLSIESTSSYYAAYMDELSSIMDSINSISLTVQTITGGNTDDALDWDILKYIPDLVETLNTYADRLEVIYDELIALDDGSNTSPNLSTLNVAAKQLRRLAKTPNKIGSKLAEFSEGSGSAYQLIGNAVSSLLNGPVSFDCIYIYQGQELPSPMGSIFIRIWDGIRGFFYSFFDTRYNNNDVDEDTLEVWVGQSSLYLDIIQSMIDQEFTEETGIKVKVSILSNVSKIVLSNATNDNPDVVLSIDDWNPYAYALRGMLTDLSELDGFDDVTANYYAGNFTPLIYGDGVYGIPETQSVYLLYYRKDILDYLDLDPPNTWEDVIDMLPILQSYQMNFYHPLGGDTSYKGYGVTTSLIYQFGGEIYSEDGTESALTSTRSVAAIKLMTDFFTIYDMPLQVSSFFEHFRSGDMPIGVSTIDLYLQLKYAAPELSGQWGVTVIPGVDNDGTVERWSTTYGKASILFANSDKQEEGWELIKWWNSVETQIEYMQKIKTGLGEKYLILTANIPALEQSVWNQDVKEVILEQAKWARIPAITPGSYIVERELSNIWNKVVIDLDNVSVAINESIPRINRELTRKNDEFGLMSLSNPNGIPYTVPMNSNLSQWITEAYDGDN